MQSRSMPSEFRDQQITKSVAAIHIALKRARHIVRCVRHERACSSRCLLHHAYKHAIAAQLRLSVRAVPVRLKPGSRDPLKGFREP